MQKKIYAAPSILSADFSRMGEAVAKLTEAGADMLHCDVMDGNFVPNISFGPKMIEDIRKHTSLPLDVHLMINTPKQYIEQFAKAGADFITFHIEAEPNPLPLFETIRKYGKKCGIVINPATEVSQIECVIPHCDMVLLMSVNPGFGGQKFIEPVMDKIKQARAIIDKSGKDILLEIDGGINAENVKAAKDAGADVIVAGSYVFNSKDMKQTIEFIRNC